MFHVSLLKAAGGPRGEKNLEGTGNQGPPPIIVEGEEAYQVHELLDSKRRDRTLQYLVDWDLYLALIALAPESNPCRLFSQYSLSHDFCL